MTSLETEGLKDEMRAGKGMGLETAPAEPADAPFFFFWFFNVTAFATIP